MAEKLFWTVVILLSAFVFFGDTSRADDCSIITADNFGRCHVEVVMGDK